MNTEAAVDIETADGKRLRGGLRTIQLTDLASDNTLVIAAVREKASGQLFPIAKIKRNP